MASASRSKPTCVPSHLEYRNRGAPTICPPYRAGGGCAPFRRIRVAIGLDGQMMKVEIWSDVACPWCYVGTLRFERAVAETGADVGRGIDFRGSRRRRANTCDCHRLLTWALETAGAETQRALKKAMLRAYFTEGAVMTDHDVLADLAAEAGLDRGEAATVLGSDRCAAEVRAARQEAHGNGIAAVPTFVVEGQFMLQGALETEAWVRALGHLQRELATG